MENRQDEESEKPMASLAVSDVISANETKTIRFLITWYFPNRTAWSSEPLNNYYSTKYKGAWETAMKTVSDLKYLEEKTIEFVEVFCESDLPEVVKEAALFNLSTLRTQTCFRLSDGNLYVWEGCLDKVGCCFGSCTHVWNYETATGFLFGELANHYLITRDTSYARSIYPIVQKAVKWMYQKHNENPNGLMPASIPFDAEMIKGHYTSHNLWCLLALRDAIRLAKGIGEEGDAEAWSLFHYSYEKAILEAIDASAKDGGYVPAGLYDFITGPAARNGFREHQTNQDWENNLLIYPTEVLEPSDYRIQATLDTIRRRKYREGIMTYRNGMHLHQYATVNQAHQYLAINDQKHALLDLYHILLHNGSTHEGYENMVEPWEDMDPWPIPPPHAWAAAKTTLLIRNMMVREYGGQAGLHEKERDLYLFSVISPAWTKKRNTIRINDAVTEMGKISAQMEFTGQGAGIAIQSQFHSPPRYIKIAIPWFVKLKDVKSNAQLAEQRDSYLIFSPEVSSIEIKWNTKRGIHRNTFQDILMSYREENSLKWRGLTDAQIIPGGKGFLLEEEKKYPTEPLSFELVKKAFIKEYQRRFKEYEAAGKQPMIIEPPLLIPVGKVKE